MGKFPFKILAIAILLWIGVIIGYLAAVKKKPSYDFDMAYKITIPQITLQQVKEGGYIRIEASNNQFFLEQLLPKDFDPSTQMIEFYLQDRKGNLTMVEISFDVHLPDEKPSVFSAPMGKIYSY